MRHARLAGFCAGLSLLVLAACGGSAAPAASSPSASQAPTPAQAIASQPIKFRLGISQFTGAGLAYYVAQDLGLWKKYGLDTTIIQMDNVEQETSLIAGNIDLVNMSPSQVMMDGLAGTNPMVLIGSTANPLLTSLYVDPSIKSVKDLAKKNIAIIRPNTAPETAAKLYLERYGMHIDDVNFVYGQSIDGTRDLLLNGKAQAAIMSPPQALQAKNKGFLELINGPSFGIELMTTGPVVTREYLAAHRDLVNRWAKGFLDAWDFITNPANEDQAVQVMAKWTKANAEDSRGTYEFDLPAWKDKDSPQVSREALQNEINNSAYPKVRAATPDAFFDNSVLQNARKG